MDGRLILPWCGSPAPPVDFAVHHSPLAAAGWARRVVGTHPEWTRRGPRGPCSQLAPSASEPHHATLLAAGWLGRLPHIDAADCDAHAVPWLGLAATTPPLSIVAFWGFDGARATPESGPLLVAPQSGAMFSLDERTAYIPHPEYHAAPLCLPAAPARFGRVINVLQAYGSNYYHWLAEVLPRLLTVRPILGRHRHRTTTAPTLPGHSARQRQPC
eukprot:442663-Prymnesium_polylepis.1